MEQNPTGKKPSKTLSEVGRGSNQKAQASDRDGLMSRYMTEQFQKSIYSMWFTWKMITQFLKYVYAVKSELFL